MTENTQTTKSDGTNTHNDGYQGRGFQRGRGRGGGCHGD